MNKQAYEYYTDLAMTKQAWGRAALSTLRPALRQTGKLVNKGLQSLAFKAPLKTADQRSTLRGLIASQRTAKTGLGSAQQALRDAYKARAAAMGGSAQDYLNANNALRAAKNNFRTAQSAYDDAVRQYGTAKTMIGLRNQVPNALRAGALTVGVYQMGKGLGLWGDEE